MIEISIIRETSCFASLCYVRDHSSTDVQSVAVHKSCGGCHANAFVMPSKQLVIGALLNHCPPNPCQPRSCCLDPRSCCLERRSRSLVAAAQSAASLCSAMRSLCVAPADAGLATLPCSQQVLATLMHANLFTGKDYTVPRDHQLVICQVSGTYQRLLGSSVLSTLVALCCPASWR